MFAARGYDRTSVADVAVAVGMSAASVFYYFGDKAALFREAFERDLPAAEALLKRHANADDPLEAILAVLESLGEDAADPSASGVLVELLRRIGDDPELRSVVTGTARVVHEGLTHLIERGIAEGVVDAELDPPAAAAWLQAIVDAAYLNARPGHVPSSELRRTALGYLASHRSRGPVDHG